MNPDSSEQITCFLKKCSKCNQVKKGVQFYKNSKKKDGYNYYCKQCHNELTGRWRELNHENVRQQCRKYYGNHPEISAKANKHWRANNVDKFNEYERNRNQNLREELNSTYVKRMICQGTRLRHSDIPDSMVAAYSESVKLKRLIKKCTKNLNHGKN